MTSDERHNLTRARTRHALHARTLACLVAVVLSWLACGEARAQGPVVAPTDKAPPLMKFIPPEDRALLEQKRDDVKGRTRQSIELADAHLSRAEQLTASQQYNAAATEIGIYQALVEDAMRYLRQNSRDKNGKVGNKGRDLYKRIELSLRTHGPRLETIRRTTPSEDAVNVRAAYEYVRAARAEALNGFYGHTVLGEDSTRKEKSPDKDDAGETNTPPDKQQPLN